MSLPGAAAEPEGAGRTPYWGSSDFDSLRCAQAHDFEAYQELLRNQTGEGAAPGERYEAISVFLSETEEYLHRCVSLSV